MKEKVCLLCGETFIPTSGRQKYCNKPVIKKCKVCGKEFVTVCAAVQAATCDNPECKKDASHACEEVERICKGCGATFRTSRVRQVYCGQDVEKNCPVCGKVMKYKCGPQVRETCSEKCQTQLILKGRSESVSSEVRVCKWCGKEFHPKEWRDVYCEGPHFKKCAVCGKEFEIDVRKDQNLETCSKECRYKAMVSNTDYKASVQALKASMEAKYGVSSPLSIPEVREKAKQTSIKRYGKEWYTQTDEYKERIKQTNLDKYGVDHPMQSVEIQSKVTGKVNELYGVDNVFQSEEIKLKIKDTLRIKYGVDYITQNPDIKDKIENNNIDKYGVKHPMMLKEFQDKAAQTNMERYGRVAYTQQHISNIQNWYKFINDPRSYINDNYQTPPAVKQLASDLGVDSTTIDVYLNRSNSFDCVRRAKSWMEEHLSDKIKLMDHSIRIIKGDKTLIHPYELDLYMPDFNFAIECNPTCTHNSSVPDPWGGDAKSYKYHKMKTDMCEEKGIQLFHIFGYEWEHKKDIILSMIRNKLGKCENVIYARKCKVIEVSGQDAIKFLNENHRQGSANSKVRLGLEYEGQLVSLMTFGKMRQGIGTGQEDLDDCWELVRFCSLLNTSVVGGASKLMKHFVKEYNPERIRSFSDRAHTSGGLYQTLGFKEVRRSEPGYVWVCVADDKAYHRANAQKKNIKQFLKDDSIDLSKTETQIMVEHGFVQVFDSGTITWEWIR